MSQEDSTDTDKVSDVCEPVTLTKVRNNYKCEQTTKKDMENFYSPNHRKMLICYTMFKILTSICSKL